MEIKNSTSLSDIPFNEDVNDFGTERYVNGLIRFIENSSAPITIALQGEWGSGKTSLMTRLEKALCSAPGSKFVGVDINTWEYSMMSSPEITVYKIIEKLVQELTKNDPAFKKIFKRFLRGAGNALYRGSRAGITHIPGLGGLIDVGLEAANVPTQLPGNNYDNDTASLSELKNSLTEAVQKTITEAGKRGVIVFVDDLDRLNPPVAVEILELLKNIFTLDNCIFVLAIDYDVVVKGLKPKYGELTEKNEREFRSFFDKIIQVPFSLPVNSYQPMNFILDSLKKIGYITELEAETPHVKSLFSTVIESSVGKNPRSIKRLINTLSLIDCITQCGDMNESLDDKLLNCIIVAIQICYPKIYRMLSCCPGFTGWNEEFAQKMGIRIEHAPGQDSSDSRWEDVLDAACMADAYLTQRQYDIIKLLDLIMGRLGKDPDRLGKKMKELMDKSSVTGVNSEIKVEDFDKKTFIKKLHINVLKRIREKRPDIYKMTLKKNYGNKGGVFFWVDDDTSFDVDFFPSVNQENKIALGLVIDLYVPRPERLEGKSFDEIMQEPAFSESIRRLDAVLSPLLAKTWFFEGRKYNGSTYFSSYTEELRYLYESNADMLNGSLANNPQFEISLGKASSFEDSNIVDTIADVLVANYDFRKSMKDFK